jgi:hypothetical protein
MDRSWQKFGFAVELSSRIQCLTFDHQNVAVQHCWCFVTAWLTLAWKDLEELPSNDGQVNVTSSCSRMKNYPPFLKKPSTVSEDKSFSTFLNLQMDSSQDWHPHASGDAVAPDPGSGETVRSSHPGQDAQDYKPWSETCSPNSWWLCQLNMT